MNINFGFSDPSPHPIDLLRNTDPFVALHEAMVLVAVYREMNAAATNRLRTTEIEVKALRAQLAALRSELRARTGRAA